VTVLLAIYLTTFALRTGGGPSRPAAVADPTALLQNVLLNAVLATAAWLVWYVVRDRPDGPASGWRSAAQVAALGVFVVVAVQFSLLLGLAVSGLYFRPRSLAWLSRAVSVAFFLAAFGIGLVLVTGISFGTGVVLGVLAFARRSSALLRWFLRGARTTTSATWPRSQNGIMAITPGSA
jgi:hypothetical protein